MTKIVIQALTGIDVVQRAAQMTTHGQPIKAPLKAWYRTEHSPVRARIFWIEALGIPTFVSVHLTRHKIGVEHFVQSMRDDRIPEKEGSSPTYSGLTADFFREMFEYRHGKLFNKTNRGRVRAGDEAGGIAARDRWMIGIGGKYLYRSVIVFMMHYGYRPPVVDHINGTPDDDRIENLRAATWVENLRNNQRRENATGFKGVKEENPGRFRARIHYEGEVMDLGLHDTAEGAALAYDRAAIVYFGEFAALNFPDSKRPITREELVNHGMLINAQALITMARKRLCYAASGKTVATFRKARNAMEEVDPDLVPFLAPDCVYRNGVCPEFKQCKPGVEKVMRAYGREMKTVTMKKEA